MNYQTTKFTTEFIIYDTKEDLLFLKIYSQGCAGHYYQHDHFGLETQYVGTCQVIDFNVLNPFEGATYKYIPDPLNVEPDRYLIIDIL